MGKVFFFERLKSETKADAAEANGVDAATELVEVQEENPEELWVNVEKNEAAEELTETEVFENLGQLKHELMEFEKVGERIKSTISSIEKLLPRLEERKERLVKDTYEKQTEVEQLTQQIPKLNKYKAELLQSIEQKEEQKKLLEHDINAGQTEVAYITKEVPKLQEQEKKLVRRIQRNQQDLTRINDHIEDIGRLQKYGIDFVSALVYSSQKSKQ